VFLGVWKNDAVKKGGQCVVDSRIAALVLQRLGYQTEPVSVWVEVTRPESPIVVGVSPAVVRASTGHMPLRHGRWLGHVVLRVTGTGGPWLVDVTFGQFSSPGDRIVAPPVLSAEWPKDGDLLGTSTGLIATYRLREDDDGAWREEYDSASTDALDQLVSLVRTWASRV
jgi:arylamine N-acetyltransferase